MKKKMLYIAELNLPNQSAQSLQILKMSDAFAKYVDVNLILFNNNSSFNNIKRLNLLKNNFNIKSIFKNRRKISFLNRVIFFFYLLKILKRKNYKYIYTRSVFVSSLLSIMGYKNLLELHIPSYSITKIIYNFSKIFTRRDSELFRSRFK